MTRAELVGHLSGVSGVSKSNVAALLLALERAVIAELKTTGEIKLPGLGKFRKRESKARAGRNPLTGEIIEIGPKTRVKFTAAKSLKDAVLG